MLFYTHLTFALLVGLYFMPDKLILVLIGSMIPDVDNVHSKINRKLRVTKIFSYLFKHRGFCHSLWFALGLFIFLNHFLPSYAGAILLGYSSHLVIDSFTKRGINYLYPVARFHVRGFIETGLGGEKLVLVLLLVCIVFLFM